MGEISIFHVTYKLEEEGQGEGVFFGHFGEHGEGCVSHKPPGDASQRTRINFEAKMWCDWVMRSEFVC